MVLPRSNDSQDEALSSQDAKSMVPNPTEPTEPFYQQNSVESSTALETEMSSEAPRQLYRSLLDSPLVAPSATTSTAQLLETSTSHEQLDSERPTVMQGLDDQQGFGSQTNVSQTEDAVDRPLDVSTQMASEILIPLLEERLVIDRQKRKVGEVVVRKEIETSIIEVPIRREKLIVEQVSPEYKQLAVVDLGQTTMDGNDSPKVSTPLTARAKFTSAAAAIEFLETITAHSSAGSTPVQVSVSLADKNLQAAYQQWLKLQSKKTNPS